MHTITAQAIANALRQARRIVIFTGAGMSAESGIATFRGQASSHWQQFKPQELASPDGWRANKQRVWAWYEGRRAQVMAAQAHAGHLAIAQLAERLQRLHGLAVQVDVVTQNVDNLHERAGSPSVIHLHGSLFAPRCAACHRPGDFPPASPTPASPRWSRRAVPTATATSARVSSGLAKPCPPHPGAKPKTWWTPATPCWWLAHRVWFGLRPSCPSAPTTWANLWPKSTPNPRGWPSTCATNGRPRPRKACRNCWICCNRHEPAYHRPVLRNQRRTRP